MSRTRLIAPPSATLEANERVQAKLAAGVPVLHLAFGEAGLPVLAEVAARLAEGAGRNAYGPVAGSAAARARALLVPDRQREVAEPHQPSVVTSSAMSHGSRTSRPSGRSS